MVRVRFAPSPTGIMHLGNIRTALLNYLFAKQKGGTFVLRIEDTDPERNFDPGGKKIIQDLLWLGLDYDEGPSKDGDVGPYQQSERTNLYAEKLNDLRERGLAYRCFCSKEDLGKKRQRQIALKQPPRYDQACANLSLEQINANLDDDKPHIWRMKIDHSQTISIDGMAHGPMKFDLKNFSDFPLSRADGSFTFMFANAVDDILMRISHVIRGEDHLSNTVGQVVLFNAFGVTPPRFWHQPILANIDGKKLSKRDFGFSLKDLTEAGFLPESINNYLAIIGGSFEHEIMSLEELVKAFNFEAIHATGQIKYDVEKLRWVNHKWLERLDNATIAQHALPFIIKTYPQAKELDAATIEKLIGAVKTDVHTLSEIPAQLAFYFETPSVTAQDFTQHIDAAHLKPLAQLIEKNLDKINNPDTFLKAIKTTCKEQDIPLKAMGTFIRMALTSLPKGLGLKILVETLGIELTTERIQNAITNIQ